MASLHALVLTVAALGGANGETVLLDFTASWCGPCKRMVPLVQQLAAAGHPVRVVDLDQQRDLANKYGVTNIPCFVMLVDGKEVDRVVGATSMQRLSSMLAKANVERESPPRRIPAQTVSDTLPSRTVDRPLDRNDRAVPPTSSAAGNGDRQSLQPLIDRLMQASARIRVTGDGQSFDTGSGTVIASRKGEVLILTCGHVFRDSAGKGRITVDFFGPQPEREVAAQLVGYDLRRDVGLIVARPSQPVTPAPVATVGYNAQPKEQVISIGCDHGKDPTAKVSQVTSIDKYIGPPNLQVAGQPEVGRSGGGLFNLQGEVIGVCNAKDPEYDEGLYAALASVHAELDRHQMQAVYARRSDTVDSRLADFVQPPAMANSMPRTIGPRSSVYELRDARLNSEEAAALSAIQTQTADILLQIQTESDVADGRRGILLGDVSPEFLRQLADIKEKQQPQSLTTRKEFQLEGEEVLSWPAGQPSPPQPGRIPPWRGGAKLTPVPTAPSGTVYNPDLQWRQRTP